jgi:hypothetical protein
MVKEPPLPGLSDGAQSLTFGESHRCVELEHAHGGLPDGRPPDDEKSAGM